MAVDIGSVNITCLIAEVVDGIPKIIGSGFSKSQGIRKGFISYIEQAAHSLKTAVEDAKQMAGVDVNKAIVSVSGVYAKSRNSSGVVTVTSGEIGINEIRRTIQAALHNATIPAEYEVIHVLPYQFIVDDQDCDDPNGMSGERLKTNVHIVTLQKTALENLKKVVKYAGIEIENIVLSSYASSIAVLSEDEKELGVVCIDIGGSTCDVMMYIGRSMCYDEVLKVGSSNITSDIAVVFNTPLNVAEDLKVRYGKLINLKDHDDNTTLQIPVVGGQEKPQVITFGDLSEVIYYRLAETFDFLHRMVENNELRPQIGAGIVFTGGLMKLHGIEEFVEAFFRECLTRIALPREIEGMPEELRDPSYATAIGLVLYGSGGFTNYEFIPERKQLKVKKSKLFQGGEELLETQETPKSDFSGVFEDDLKKETEEKENAFVRAMKKFGNLF